MTDQDEFEPRLNRFDATMIVMGAIVGAGVFFTPQTIARNVESPLAALGVWVVGGIIALMGATTYAELGARLPRAGGQYIFLRETYGGLAGFLYGWMLLLAIVSGAIAVVALIFAEYLGRLLPEAWTEVPFFEPGVAIGLILVLTGVNAVGIRPGSIVQNVFTLLKIGALAGLLAAGLLRGSPTIAFSVEASPLEGAGSLTAALAAVLFSFGGWQNLTYVATEVKEPRRNLPLALLIGVLGVTVLYLCANYAFLSLLPLETIRTTHGFASEAMRVAFGPAGDSLFAAAICCSTLGITNVLLLATPRVYYAMARDGVFFKKAGRLHPRFRTPLLAILVQGIWPSALVLIGNVGSLLNYVVFADWIFFGLTGFSLLLLRRKTVEEPETYRSIGYPLVPLLFAGTSLAVVVSLLTNEWTDSRYGLGLLAAGIPVYFLWRKLVPR